MATNGKHPSLLIQSTSSGESSCNFVSPLENYRSNYQFQKTSLHQKEAFKKLTFSSDKLDNLYNLTQKQIKQLGYDLPSLSHQAKHPVGEKHKVSLKGVRSSFNNLHFFNNAGSRFSHAKFDQQPTVLGTSFEPGRSVKGRAMERNIRKQVKMLKEAQGKGHNAKHLSKFFTQDISENNVEFSSKSSLTQVSKHMLEEHMFSPKHCLKKNNNFMLQRSVGHINHQSLKAQPEEPPSNVYKTRNRKANYTNQICPNMAASGGDFSGRLSNNLFQTSIQDSSSFESLHQQSKQQDLNRLNNLKKSLKQTLQGASQHQYIDKILSQSPNWKNLSSTKFQMTFADPVSMHEHSTQNNLFIQQANTNTESSPLNRTSGQQTDFSTSLDKSPSPLTQGGKGIFSKGLPPRPQHSYIPGKNQFEASKELKKILKESESLKKHDTKMWLRRKVKGMSSISGNNSSEGSPEKSPISSKYLMSSQEIKQNYVIETIFKKFDLDGSGALDTGELLDLFKQNKINLDRETVVAMFGSEEFTLEKFKAIISSEEDLDRFKRILKQERDKIMTSNHDYESVEKHISIQVQSVEAPLKLKKQKLLSKKTLEELTTEMENLDFNDIDQLSYLPATFEGMMECFGVNLQRMNLYQDFHDSIKDLSSLCRRREYSKLDVIKGSTKVCDIMKKILTTTIADSSSLKNQHNELFLSLMSKLDRVKKEQEVKTQRLRQSVLLQSHLQQYQSQKIPPIQSNPADHRSSGIDKRSALKFNISSADHQSPYIQQNLSNLEFPEVDRAYEQTPLQAPLNQPAFFQLHDSSPASADVFPAILAPMKNRVQRASEVMSSTPKIQISSATASPYAEAGRDIMNKAIGVRSTKARRPLAALEQGDAYNVSEEVQRFLVATQESAEEQAKSSVEQLKVQMGSID